MPTDLPDTPQPPLAPAPASSRPRSWKMARPPHQNIAPAAEPADAPAATLDRPVERPEPTVAAPEPQQPERPAPASAPPLPGPMPRVLADSIASLNAALTQANALRAAQRARADAAPEAPARPVEAESEAPGPSLEADLADAVRDAILATAPAASRAADPASLAPQAPDAPAAAIPPLATRRAALALLGAGCAGAGIYMFSRRSPALVAEAPVPTPAPPAVAPLVNPDLERLAANPDDLDWMASEFGGRATLLSADGRPLASPVQGAGKPDVDPGDAYDDAGTPYDPSTMTRPVEALYQGAPPPGGVTDAAVKRYSPADLAYLDRNAPKTERGNPAIRGLWLVNPHTKEQIVTLFWSVGHYDNLAYSQICTLMRDWRENKIVAMDPKLLHLIWAIQRETGFTDPVMITSAFRTEKTNRMLRVEGAAVDSQHLHSRAADIQIAGKPPTAIAHKAQELGLGGVGLYPRFVHLDTARKRTWNG